MTERWRKPVKIAELIPNPSETVRIGGRTYAGTEYLLEDEDDFSRIRAGYVCMQCMEPHPEPFPEHCIVCGFAMRSQQTELLDAAYKGERWVGPRMSIDDEIERLVETNERAMHNPQSSIILPPGVSLQVARKSGASLKNRTRKRRKRVGSQKRARDARTGKNLDKQQ